MGPQDPPWDQRILDSMEPGSVTFAWDDGEIRTVRAPDSALDKLQSAWQWIDAQMKEMEPQRGRPRSICFRLSSGEFRGLTFPDWKPGAM